MQVSGDLELNFSLINHMGLNEVDSLDRMILCKYIYAKGSKLVGSGFVIQIDTDHLHNFVIGNSKPLVSSHLLHDSNAPG